MAHQLEVSQSLKRLIIGGMLLIRICGYAQEKTDTLKTKILREMVVTATKFYTPAKETPRRVEVISSKEISRSSAQDLAQVLQRQSGIMVPGSYSNPGAVKSLFVRGGTNNYTSILIDGIPVKDPSGVGGAVDLRLLPLGQIERIEIMKGSQSSLYGSGAISGVINLITKKNSEKKFDLKGNLSVGSWATGKGNMNIGIRTELFECNLGAQYFFTAGVSEARPKQKNLTFEQDKFARKGINANFSFKPIDHLVINPYIRFVDSKGAYDGGAFTDADSSFYHADMVGAGAIIDYNVNKIKTRVSYGYTYINRAFTNPLRINQFKGRMHDMDGYVSYDVLKNLLNLSGGINYQYQQMLDTTSTTINPAMYLFSSYWNVRIKPFKTVLTELSYRLNVHEKYGINHTYSGAVSWWGTSHIKLFASYNIGYKAPTLSQLYGRFGANERLKPQRSASWEAGGEAHMLRDKLWITATYYDRSINDLIVYTPQGYMNRDVQHNQGVEVTTRWSPDDSFTVRLIYNFMTGSITEHNSSQSDTTYNNMFKRPAQSAQAIVIYKPVKQAFIRLTGQYMGDRSDVFFDTSFYASKQVEIKAYFLLNAYLEYEVMNQKAFLFADLRNITNIDFSETYGYTTPGFGIQCGLRLHL